MRTVTRTECPGCSERVSVVVGDNGQPTMVHPAPPCFVFKDVEPGELLRIALGLKQIHEHPPLS